MPIPAITASAPIDLALMPCDWRKTAAPYIVRPQATILPIAPMNLRSNKSSTFSIAVFRESSTLSESFSILLNLAEVSGRAVYSVWSGR